MKIMYINVFAACCLIATITHASENQGRSFKDVVAGSGTVSRRTIASHPVAIALRNVSTVGQEKPIVFPFTNHNLFDAHENPVYEPKGVYKKNTQSHKAGLRIIIPVETDFPSAEEIFAPTAPLTQTVETRSAHPLLMLTDKVVTSGEEDGYASSDFEDSRHVSAGKLSSSRFTFNPGYGYSYLDAALLAIEKKQVPGTSKKAKFKNKRNELGAALADTVGAPAEKLDRLTSYAESQMPSMLNPTQVSIALQAAKQLELTNLTASVDPLLLVTKAQAAKVKAAQEALAKEEKALQDAQKKIAEAMPAAHHRAEITDTLRGILQHQLPQAPAIPDNLPDHEKIAQEIAARKAGLLARLTPTAAAKSNPESQLK